MRTKRCRSAVRADFAPLPFDIHRGSPPSECVAMLGDMPTFAIDTRAYLMTYIATTMTHLAARCNAVASSFDLQSVVAWLRLSGMRGGALGRWYAGRW